MIKIGGSAKYLLYITYQFILQIFETCRNTPTMSQKLLTKKADQIGHSSILVGNLKFCREYASTISPEYLIIVWGFPNRIVRFERTNLSFRREEQYIEWLSDLTKIYLENLPGVAFLYGNYVEGFHRAGIKHRFVVTLSLKQRIQIHATSLSANILI